MNANRRKQIAKIKDRLNILMGEAASLSDELAELRDEEQEYFDNMPDSMQSGDKGDKAQRAIDAMDNVAQLIEDFSTMDADELDTAAD